MKTKVMTELPEFRLRAYDRLKPRTSTPRAVAVAEVSGRRFALRCEHRIVFFREIESEKPDWTFAVLPRIEERHASNAEALEKFFVGNFRTRNIARFHPCAGCFWRELPLFFASAGSGVCREYYNDDDLPFSWRDDEKWNRDAIWNLENDDLEVIACGISETQIIEPLGAMDFGNSDHGVATGYEVEFLCGSPQELTRLTRWICWCMEPQIFQKAFIIKLSFASENQYTRAHLCSLQMGEEYNDANSYWFDLNSSDHLALGEPLFEIYGERVMPFSEHALRLFDLALDYNTPAGVHWEYNDEGSGRASFSPGFNSFKVAIEMPTEDEQRAAREELRAWLAGKVPASEIEELISE